MNDYGFTYEDFYMIETKEVYPKYVKFRTYEEAVAYLFSHKEGVSVGDLDEYIKKYETCNIYYYDNEGPKVVQHE